MDESINVKIQELSPDGSRWFRISEKQLYYLQILAEQHGALRELFGRGTSTEMRTLITDGVSYSGLRNTICEQEILMDEHSGISLDNPE